MSQSKAIKISLSLQDTQIPVTRTVIWHNQITCYEIHLLINGLFNFEETKDVELTYGEKTMRMVGDDVDDAFVITLDKIDLCDGEPLYYTYAGESKWTVTITLTYLEEQPNKELPYFAEGTGQGILNPDLTISEYNEYVAAAQNNNLELLTTSIKKLAFIGTDITELSAEKMEKEVQKVYTFYNQILAIEKQQEQGCGCGHHHHHEGEAEGCGCGHHHHEVEAGGCGCGHHHDHEGEAEGCGCGHHHHHEVVQQSTLDDSGMNFEEEQEMIAQTLETYTQILGLTEEQAAYLVLYTGAIETIIEEMENAGYDEESIDRMMQGKLAMDESIYEAIAESLELLESLPPREEMLSEEDEQKLAILDSIMNETVATLAESGVDINALMEAGGEFPEDVEEEMLKKLLSELGEVGELN